MVSTQALHSSQYQPEPSRCDTELRLQSGQMWGMYLVVMVLAGYARVVSVAGPERV
jgi:hypothetical protein